MRDDKRGIVWAAAQRIERVWKTIQAHETAPEPYRAGRAGAIGLAVVTVLAAAYTLVLAGYTVGLQYAFRTNAEDLGIMVQVLWSIVNGHGMHQTICNAVTDTNCAAGTSRYAIHFEPALYLVSLVYRVFPHVWTILILQVAVVASGVYPAYLLATRRLRHPLWGVIASAFYLASPPLLAAVIDDFHPEALAAAILLWAFYFLTLRRYGALAMTCVLALLCKETLTLDVMAIGVFVTIIHRRPRVGLALVALGAATLVFALILMHVTSPLGRSPVAGRLDPLLQHPLQTVWAAAHDRARIVYIGKLLLPLGFLPLLSPWVAVLAAPSIALNALSASADMYSGRYQYNTDIVVVLLVAAIDALVWIVPAVRMVAKRIVAPSLWRLFRMRLARVTLAIMLVALLVAGAGNAFAREYSDVRAIWPGTDAHTRIGMRMLSLIPPDASVSAQSMLVPHLSKRQSIYQFPAGDDTAQYVFVDVSSTAYYPFTSPQSFISAIQQTLTSGDYAPVAAEDGYLLLRRTAPGQGTSILPPDFYSFIYTSLPPSVRHVDARFGDTLEFVGFTATRPPTILGMPALFVNTYWRATAPVRENLTITITLTRPDGTRDVYEELIGQNWLPPSQWQAGKIVYMQAWPIYLPASPAGSRILGVEVRVGAPASAPGPGVRLPVTLATSPASETANALPRVAADGLSLQLESFTSR